MWFSGSLWSVDVLGVVPVSLCIPSCRALIVLALQHINILSLSNYRKKCELLIIFMSTNTKFLSGLWFCLSDFLFSDPKSTNYTYRNCNGSNFNIKYM